MESNAFSRIAEENMQGLYRLSFSILHTRHDAQDAVQQGLLRAWERRETARPEQIRAWLTRIVINECHKLRRFAIGRNRPRVVIAIEYEPDSRIVFLIGNRITVFIGRY